MFIFARSAAKFTIARAQTGNLQQQEAGWFPVCKKTGGGSLSRSGGKLYLEPDTW